MRSSRHEDRLTGNVSRANRLEWRTNSEPKLCIAHRSNPPSPGIYHIEQGNIYERQIPRTYNKYIHTDA